MITGFGLFIQHAMELVALVGVIVALAGSIKAAWKVMK